MGISYRNLWYRLVEKRMKKKELMEKAGFGQYHMHKLLNNMDVSTKLLRSICVVLECDIGEIVEVILPRRDCEEE